MTEIPKTLQDIAGKIEETVLAAIEKQETGEWDIILGSNSIRMNAIKGLLTILYVADFRFEEASQLTDGDDALALVYIDKKVWAIRFPDLVEIGEFGGILKKTKPNHKACFTLLEETAGGLTFKQRFEDSGL